MNKRTTIFLVLAFIQLFAAAQDKLSAGWKAFNENKREEARQLFEQATKDNSTKSQAYLALSLWHWNQDDSKSSQAAFREFIRLSEQPYPYLYGMWNTPALFEGESKMEKEQLVLLRQLVDDPKTNNTIRAMSYAALGKHYFSIGDFKQSEEMFSKIGSIEQWQILGTFDNTSGSGFNKDFGALANPKPDAVFKNKVNADIRWYRPPHFRMDRWFDFEYYMIIGNSIMYAQTFVQSPTDQDVFIRTGTSGSLKVWVNDKLITNIPDERNCDMDIYINNAKLKQGYNRILVQIGESETNNANFLLRITDKDGNPIKGLTVKPEYQPYPKAEEYTVNTYPLFAEEYFENKIKQEPNNITHYLVLAQVYMRNDKAYEARKVLKKARELAPRSTLVGRMLIEAFARDKNVTDLTREHEKIKTEDPESIYALKALYDEAKEREDIDEAENLLEKIKKLYGKSEYTDLQDLNILVLRKRYDKLVTAAKELFAKYPDNYDLMALNYKIETSSSKDLNNANKILQEFLSRNYSDKVLVTLADNYFKLGKNNEGYKLYQQRIENLPYAIAYYGDLADLYYNERDYKNALKWAEKQLEFAPYIGSYWFKIGKIKQAMGSDDEAKKCFQKAIYYMPTNYEARRQLRKLEGKKALFENFEKTDVYELYKKSPGSSEYPDDNSIVLLHEVQRVVYPEGATEERVELLVKVLNQAGIDIWKEYSIGFNQHRQRLIIDKAEVLKKDGNKIQAEKDENYIVFTNLETGDAIHLSYRIENYNTGKLAQHFWEEFNFNYEFPSLIARYSLLIPENIRFQHKLLRADKVKSTVSDVEDMKLYVWEMNQQPAISPEPYMSTLADIGAVLHITTLPDWKFVSNWYSDLSSTLAKTDFVIKEAVSELFKDKSNLSELQKARMIYDYIEQNVSYSNVPFMHGPIIPQKASRTLTTRLGDCKDVATLFVAMCKEAGLKANLLLVDTRDNGDEHLVLPSIDFNHCIAQLSAGGKTYYIELTDQRLSFASLPITDINANALFIPREGDAPGEKLYKLNNANRVPNQILRETEVRFENNDMLIQRKTVKTGALAAQMRTDYADIGKDKQEKSLLQAVSSDFSNPTKLNSLSFADLKTLSDSVNYNYSITVKNELTDVIGIKIFRLPWSEGIRSLDFLSQEKREYPLVLWHWRADELCREVMNVVLPQGKALAELPKNVTLSCAAADYTLTYSVPTPGKLRAERSFKFKKDVVLPSEYEQFREFINKVAEADGKQLGFK
ncbi:MAG: DUF3857 domain-containing protein [Chitinophagales bacterium]|nr:DUF3857 domain-containing protein [Chitinophagales bacterium]MDW8418809.1 DUF3857 domain-containing protein [Chitinophagales bacterium]